MDFDPRWQLNFDESLDHLAEYGWLEVEKAVIDSGRPARRGGGNLQVKGYRIRLGREMLKALEKRPDIS